MVRFPANVVKSNGGELVGGIGQRVDGERFAAPSCGCVMAANGWILLCFR
jgi:hypothetical protein